MFDGIELVIEPRWHDRLEGKTLDFEDGRFVLVGEESEDTSSRSELPMKRPRGIKIIAWSWIAFGALLALSAIVGLLADATVRAPAVPGAIESPNIRLVTFLLGNVKVLLILLFVVAVISIWAGVALYQLKGWGRMLVEMESWLAVRLCSWIHRLLALCMDIVRGSDAR